MVLSGGDILQARILHLDDEHRDVICDVLSTTKPEIYKKGIEKTAYAIRWDDIVSFVECQI